MKLQPLRSALVALTLPLCASHSEAQSKPIGAVASSVEHRWLLRGEIGGVLGGTWLTGVSAPTVSSKPGVSLSLDAHRATGRRVNAGAAVRMHAQPLTLREHGISWDGGTLTDAQFLGTMAIALHRGNRLQSAVELGGGLALLAGARTIYPFTDAGRVTLATEGGVSVQRNDARQSRSLALVIRYGVVRLDPGPASVTDPDAMHGSAGWVGRASLGLRVQR